MNHRLSGDQDGSPNQKPGLVVNGASGASVTTALVVINGVKVGVITTMEVDVGTGFSAGASAKVGVMV